MPKPYPFFYRYLCGTYCTRKNSSRCTHIRRGSRVVMEAALHLALLQVTLAERTAILTSGFRDVADFDNMDAATLSQLCGVSETGCHKVIRCLNTPVMPRALMIPETPPQRIITCSKTLDQLLGGGIMTGTVTELVGTPGSGKTQVAMQAALNACLPTSLGGGGGSCLIVDAEGSVSLTRCKQMAAGLVGHIQRTPPASVPSHLKGALSGITPEKLLCGINVVRCVDMTQLVALIRRLPKIAAEMQNCVLVVIDSIAFAFRQDDSMYSTKIQVLSSLGLQLRQAAAEGGYAVLVLNQATTKMTPGGSMSLQPALGVPWAHASETKLWLSRTSSNEAFSSLHRAEVLKAPHTSRGATTEFMICSEGVRDL